MISIIIYKHLKKNKHYIKVFYSLYYIELFIEIVKYYK